MTSGTRPQFRLHGDIVPINEFAEILPDQMRQILREISPDKNWRQFEEENDTDFAYELPGLRASASTSSWTIAGRAPSFA